MILKFLESGLEKIKLNVLITLLQPLEKMANQSYFDEQGSSLLLDVMSHPVIILASDSFKNLEERIVSFGESDSESSTKDRYVYIFQREYAVVNPELVDVCSLPHFAFKVGESLYSSFLGSLMNFLVFLLMRSLLAPMKQQLA